MVVGRGPSPRSMAVVSALREGGCVAEDEGLTGADLDFWASQLGGKGAPGYPKEFALPGPRLAKVHTPITLSDPAAQATYEKLWREAKAAKCQNCGAKNLFEAAERDCPACCFKYIGEARR